MKLAILAAALVFAGLAQAATEYPSIDAYASAFEGRPMHVLCYDDPFEDGSPKSYEDWAYVSRLDPDTVHMDGMLCAGALRIADPTLSATIRAFSASVLIHELYHQRRDLAGWDNEARTECRAIKHVDEAIAGLGGSVEELHPVAIRLYWGYVHRHPEYWWKSCQVPK